MTAPGRPPIGPAIMVRIPPPLLATVDHAARLGGMSRAAMIRELIEKGLKL